MVQDEDRHPPRFEFALERSYRDSQLAGSVSPIAAMLLERLLHGRPFKVFERRATGDFEPMAAISRARVRFVAMRARSQLFPTICTRP